MKDTGLPFNYRILPDGVNAEYVSVAATDGIETSGLLHTRSKGGRARVAALVMHPRADFFRHYAAPLLARRGCDVLAHTTRYLNNDTDAVHEKILLDMAAAMRLLRDRGYEQIVLLGNSGGGSLSAFYQWQASLAPSGRLSASPGGYPIDLPREDMPLAAGAAFVAAHAGEGHFMQKIIDPAVAREDDPSLTDPELDLYNPANGRQPFPANSDFDLAWVIRYRKAQLDRCRRLDLIAHGYLNERLLVPQSPEPDEARRHDFERRRRTMRYMLVYRTLADPEHLDLSIDPSDRPLGTVFFEGDPMLGNYGMNGIGRTLTPRAWLSTWSPNTTRASLPRNIAKVTVPSLFVEATGDTEIRPAEFKRIVEASGAADVTVGQVKADHYLRPLSGGPSDPRSELADMIAAWLDSRFK